jgi:predicted Rossmann fold nucleotide-binding protein DprA/Smf involved in DNA uptake
MAPFSANAVIGRSKIIYGLSGVTIVVTVAENQGATWAGATEALDKHFGRVMVWMGPGAGPGNGFLVPAGAIPVDRPELVLERH